LFEFERVMKSCQFYAQVTIDRGFLYVHQMDYVLPTQNIFMFFKMLFYPGDRFSEWWEYKARL